MLVHAAIYFAALAAATTILSLVPKTISARFWITVPLGLGLLAVVTISAALVGHMRQLDCLLAGIAVVATVAVRAFERRWSWFGALLFASATLAFVAYLVYAASITYVVGRDPIYLVASSLLFLLELAALTLSTSYLFEIVDVLSRATRPTHPSDREYLPCVVVQVPAYNEPLEVMSQTLASLAALDYPHVIVQVVDNNTPDPKLWKALQSECERLGPRFHFIHLENWPGFKAGALNEATRRLPPDVDLVAIVDSDYVVTPDWLRSVVGHFADPKVAFVQCPQNYRDWQDDQYLRGLFYSYEYFFEISMPARSHRNAIIFAGTMGVIRRSALDQIGGWNSDVVTEDAEASLRMLANGHIGIYEPRAFGHGLMPLSFAGLKQQRFRWALGGIQILRLHWKKMLLPGHGGRLTAAQRAQYLLGNVQWFGDVFMFVFTVLLVLTALSTALHHVLPIRQLTGVALALPLIFLWSGILRAVWAMKLKTRCTWRDTVAALRVWFALSWVVTLACLRGLVRFHTAFLRTPKSKDGDASVVKALKSAQIETLLAATGAAAAIAMLVRVPTVASGALALLLLFQAAVYSNGPWASAAAERVYMTPLRRAYRNSAQSTGARPAAAEAFAISAALGAAALIVVFLVSLATPPAPAEPQQPLPGIGLPSTGSAPARTSPSASPSASATSSPSPSSVPAPPSAPSTPASPTASPP